MIEDDKNGMEQAAGLDRRSLLIGGAASIAATTLPDAAQAAKSAKTGGDGLHIYGAVYMDPNYLKRFNNVTYAAGNIQNVHDTIKLKCPNRNDLKWGNYQQVIEPLASNWGTTAAYNNWPDLSQEARDDVEKQPAKFADPKNAMNPFDTTQVAANLLDHLDEVVRIALWDHAVPIKIKVTGQRRRHHGLTTEWDSVPPPSGVNPNLQLKGLTINVECPKGGWQGYALWRNKSSTEHITKFAAKWQVPPAPTVQDGQILFVFIGLESVSGRNATGGILQPVLQWTKDGWYMRSWYVTADFDPVKYPNLPDVNTAVGQDHLGDENRCYSKAVKVNTGDTIVGVITGGKDATGKFNYTCSLDLNGQHQTETELPFVDIPELVYAVCAVESYDIKTKPGDYPAGSIQMSSIDLQVEQSSVTPIKWKKNKKLGGDYVASSSTSGSKVDFTLV
jgi:hypothetical protein